jgi:alginate O-acetyltransferase complex protein AlgI
VSREKNEERTHTNNIFAVARQRYHTYSQKTYHSPLQTIRAFIPSAPSPDRQTAASTSMNFISFQFVGFVLVVYVAYWSIRSNTGRVALLVFASCVFYAAWDWRFLALMWLVTFNAYVAGLALNRETRVRPILFISIGADLLVLGIFKYLGFLSHISAMLLEAIGATATWPSPHIILPVGISFYTFHAISYVMDVSRKKILPQTNFLKVALYISFFPQLIAGPIVRASFFMPQLSSLRKMHHVRHLQGLQLFLIGFVYKALIADSLAQICDPVYAQVGAATQTKLLEAATAFYGQIYFDFAGYSLMAIGTARLFSYRFPKNFDFPYSSLSVTEFWHRWHISLSTWLRDYLYIPLGGNRGSTLFYYRNLMLTMVLGGLWHGASWNFIAWGAAHGLGLCVHKIWIGARHRIPVSPDLFGGWTYKIFALLLTQVWVFVAWIFFRAASFGDATIVLKALISSKSYSAPVPIILILLTVAIDSALGRKRPFGRGLWRAPTTGPLYWMGMGAFITITIMMLPMASKSFIYFQF